MKPTQSCDLSGCSILEISWRFWQHSSNLLNLNRPAWIQHWKSFTHHAESVSSDLWNVPLMKRYFWRPFMRVKGQVQVKGHFKVPHREARSWRDDPPETWCGQLIWSVTLTSAVMVMVSWVKKLRKSSGTDSEGVWLHLRWNLVFF